jgi:pyruvate dehydrogenase E1 component alpha subunit
VERLSVERLTSFYRTMARIRETEERIADLVTAGEVKTPCHLYIGQEAIATGVCAALTDDDYVWGGHRSHGHYLAKGGSLRAMVAEIFGRVTGCSAGRGGSMHLVAQEVGILGTVPLVAATIPLAVGAGMAARLRGERRVSVAFFGDGAVEEGHFHESLNLAAVYKAPVVFVCENNLYASHMGLLERRAADNIHLAGAAHGAPGYSIDGNDVLAVYGGAVAAVARARNGEGPTLLEYRTYRWRGHVGPSWDMDVGVKRKDELQDWLPRDPLVRLARQLQASGVPASALDALVEEIRREVRDAVEFARASPYPEASGMMNHVYCAPEARA